MSFPNTLLLSNLIESAQKTPLKFKLSSCLLKGSKKYGKIHNNCEGSYCRRRYISSVHSEVKTLKTHFGKSLRYSKSSGWYLLQHKKREKYKKVKLNSYQNR